MNNSNEMYVQALRVWHTTNLAKAQHQLVTSMFGKLGALHKKSVSIIDIGTGDGCLLEQICDLCRISGIEISKLGIIDLRGACVDFSRKTLTKIGRPPDVSIECDLRDISKESFFRNWDNCIFLMSSVLHEVSLDQRRILIEKLSPIGTLLISELEARHDLYYPEHIVRESVQNFIEILRDQIITSNSPIELQNIGLRYIVAAEENDLLSGGTRINRHYTQQSLVELLEDLGLEHLQKRSELALPAFCISAGKDKATI